MLNVSKITKDFMSANYGTNALSRTIHPLIQKSQSNLFQATSGSPLLSSCTTYSISDVKQTFIDKYHIGARSFSTNFLKNHPGNKNIFNIKNSTASTYGPDHYQIATALVRTGRIYFVKFRLTYSPNK